MIEWQGRPEQRLRSWRQFRLQLLKLSKSKALAAVSHEWGFCPFVNKYLVPHDATQWPDPWTLLSEGKFCSLARALGMLYTVALCDQFANAEIGLQIYSNIQGERYDLVCVDNCVLNYVHGIPVNVKEIDNSLMLQFSYSKTDLRADEFK